MAAPAVTFYQRRPIVPSSNFAFGQIGGLVTIASYDNTHPPVTALTGKFRNAGVNLNVQVNGVTSAGYAVTWDTATSSFKCYTSNGAAPAVLAEAPNAANCGTVQFLATGQISA